MLANNPQFFFRLTSDQVGIPAELKHINKRRKRNQQGLPQVRVVICRRCFGRGSGLSSLEQDVIEGENPLFRRVELFGNAAQNGW
ncbi:hypothetical protein LSUB1_G007486 [Lachnellula subtilissima]|uniref:Uncharacterized protein n=1 Tax=Lachnellula subtilissima TaxID=602034 RepID=A0A8H8RBX1_9HELO|nr:hypothetical protein LSUB1_G007486 [Lachnellula subtilissima]